MQSDARNVRRGMTLIEVVAALVVAGFVILGCLLLLDGSSDAAKRMTDENESTTHEGTGALLLERLLRDVERNSDTTRRFRGDERSLDYFGRCERPSGWMTSCHVTVAVDSTRDSSIVLAQVDAGTFVSMRRRRGAAVFRYFDPSHDTVWVRQWQTNATLPVAVGLVVGADTTVFPVGASRD